MISAILPCTCLWARLIKLKIADLNRDVELLEAAKAIAEKLLKEYPAEVEQHLDRWMVGASQLVKV
jgi:ATP-dependent DNA helicase RecG